MHADESTDAADAHRPPLALEQEPPRRRSRHRVKIDLDDGRHHRCSPRLFLRRRRSFNRSDCPPVSQRPHGQLRRTAAPAPGCRFREAAAAALLSQVRCGRGVARTQPPLLRDRHLHISRRRTLRSYNSVRKRGETDQLSKDPIHLWSSKVKTTTGFNPARRIFLAVERKIYRKKNLAKASGRSGTTPES